MPAKSQAQAAFMAEVMKGVIHKAGLSRTKAAEYLRGVDVKSLPKKLHKK